MSNILQNDSPNYAEKLFFDFLSKAYGVFLAGNDDFEPLEQEMAYNFEQRNADTIREIERLREENEQLRKELEALDEKNVSIIYDL
jgi:kinetochore protein NDC80